MGEDVKRAYDTTGRRARSDQRRQRIVEVARDLMVRLGYRRASLALIAEGAGVNVDTVYELVGRKSVILREVLEQAISGVDRAVPAEERDYVVAIRDEPEARQKLRLYAAAVRQIQERIAPVFKVVREAVPSEPDVADMWKEITRRRAHHMRAFVEDVAGAAPLRGDLTVDRAADIVWLLNSSDVYLLLTDERGWTADEYEQWLADTWTRLLLAD